MNFYQTALFTHIADFASILLGAFFISYIIIPKLSLMFYNAGFVRPNYQNAQVPLGMGLTFLIAALLVVAALIIAGKTPDDAYLFMFVISLTGMVGFLDDVLGTRKASGLAGHFRSLISGNLTTGALKALTGGMIAFIVSLQALDRVPENQKAMVFILNALMVALFTNSINLLDLRPGRAGKGYILAVLILLIISGNNPQVLYLGAVSGSVLAYLNMDLRGKAMMGDTGSNILGVTLGYVAVFTLPLIFKIYLLSFLILLHLFTEKYSLTKVIERNRILNYLDEIGRR